MPENLSVYPARAKGTSSLQHCNIAPGIFAIANLPMIRYCFFLCSEGCCELHVQA